MASVADSHHGGRTGALAAPFRLCVGACWLLASWLAPAAAAAPVASGDQTTQNPAPTSSATDPDRQIVLAEPDFTLGALPTSLRMPRGAFAFRMTHRFTRPIASGSAGDFFADFFGFDAAARTGLELRYGLARGTQVAVHRTGNRAIQFLGQQEIVGQSAHRPLSIDALAAVEGGNNFREDFSTTLGAIVSRRFGDCAAFYVEPIAVWNSNPNQAANGLPDYTVLLGVGTRVRLGNSKVYVVAEVAPQIAGYKAGVDHASVGLERRAGGHLFQLTVSNGLGTTMRQVAQGGIHHDDWFIGFNLSRRFF